MEFPDSCIRGITNSTCLTEVSTVASTSLYEFSKMCRADGWIEESINWNDDTNAIDFTWKQKNENGEYKFKIGIAILPHIKLDTLIRRHGIADRFKYERTPVQEPPNKYHGNLLMRKDVGKPLKNILRSQLAWASNVRLRQE